MFYSDFNTEKMVAFMRALRSLHETNETLFHSLTFEGIYVIAVSMLSDGSTFRVKKELLHPQLTANQLIADLRKVQKILEESKDAE